MRDYFLIIITFPSLLVALSSCGEKAEEAKPSKLGKVYFICRSAYEVPLGHRIIEFDEPDLLNWFRNNWLQKDLRNRLESPTQKGAWVRTDIPKAKSKDGDIIPFYDYEPIHKHTHELLNGSVYGFLDVWKAMQKWEKSLRKIILS